MTNSRDQTRDEESAFASLWRRAPLWRATIVGAVLVTVAAAVFRAESPSAMSAPAHSATSTVPAMAAGSQKYAQSQASPSVIAATERESVENGPASGSVADEDEQAQAVCHPHLLHAPSMPQIDVAGNSAPNLGHIKIHFWVNGAGAVTREVLTAATLGTHVEQEAETSFAKQLTFSVPHTRDCQSREIELIGDFFEQREQTGSWATFVRLYPRFTIGNSGSLERAE
jgi:hypothetical protein